MPDSYDIDFMSGRALSYIDYMEVTPCDMRCHVSPHLSHELHIPSVNALQPQPGHHHDHESFVQEDPESDQQPSSIPPRPRLDLPSTSDAQPRSHPRGLSAPSSDALEPRQLVAQHEHECPEQYQRDHQRRSEDGAAGQR